MSSSSLDISQDKALLWLMALACGVCAGANYYCQPIISSIQQSFAVTEAEAALTVTFAQVSYALGLLILVPLGDLLNKQKFIPYLMLTAAAGLFLCAFAVNLPMLWLGTIMTGLFSVAAQVLIPMATMATPTEKTGQVVGFLMSGLLVGILLSTSLAGLLSQLFHWKLIYLLSGSILLVLAYGLAHRLPYLMRMNLSIGTIYRSMGKLLIEEKRLVIRSLSGAFAFGSMSTLFSTIAVYLSSSPFSMTDFQIGLVSLVGLFGALSTQWVGRFADKGWTTALSLFGGCVLLFSWGLFYQSTVHILYYLFGFALLNLGLAIVHSCNQNIIFRLRPDAKSRLNSIYMTLYFIGAAAGSALGIFAWHHGGWFMTCVAGLGLAVAAMLCILLDLLLSKKMQKVKRLV